MGAARYSVCSAQELDDRYGDVVRSLVMEKTTAYQLCKALRERASPVYVSDGVAKQWLAKQRIGQVAVQNCGHLESRLGDRIRAHFAVPVSGDELSHWLLHEHGHRVPVAVCRAWIDRTWSYEGVCVSSLAVEEKLGERLRLVQYSQCFATDEDAKSLSDALSESQPPWKVSPAVLRQWYTRYHPSSGPLKYETAAALDEALGDRLRSVYVAAGVGFRAMRVALAQARKVALYIYIYIHIYTCIYIYIYIYIHSLVRSLHRRPCRK